MKTEDQFVYDTDMGIAYDVNANMSAIPVGDTWQGPYSFEGLWAAWLYYSGCNVPKVQALFLTR